MAWRDSTAAEAAAPTTGSPERSEGELLQRLLGLYAEERQLYGRVLELSRRQGDIVRRGGGLAEVRGVLEQKKRCLEIISRLELTERRSKQDWERRRAGFSAESRSRLQAALGQVSRAIEEILACEEQNDLDLIEQASVVG